jgi:hypothetical protein
MPKVAVKQDLSPIECKEHLDEVLEMESEVDELETKMDKAQELYKDAKSKFELKRDEVRTYLKGLNEEHPLFDEKNTVDIPWAFPLPDDTHEATLANVAADPVVLGLSVSMVKSIREKIQVSTLGQLEKHMKADKKLTPEQQSKAKQQIGKELGPNLAMRVLRAVASFTGNRTKSTKKGKADPETKPIEKTNPVLQQNWRETKVADLDAITPMQAQLLGQLQLPTVGKLLTKIEELNRNMPTGAPADWTRKALASYLALTPAAAGKIIDAVFKFEEAELGKEKQ